MLMQLRAGYFWNGNTGADFECQYHANAVGQQDVRIFKRFSEIPVLLSHAIGILINSADQQLAGSR